MLISAQPFWRAATFKNEQFTIIGATDYLYVFNITNITKPILMSKIALPDIIKVDYMVLGADETVLWVS